MARRTGFDSPRVSDPDLARWIERVTQRLRNIDGTGGGGGGGGTTVLGGGATPSTGGGTTPPTSPTLPTLTTPPKPVGVTAIGGVNQVAVTWGNPFRVYVNHARARVYRSETANFDQATEIGQAAYVLYIDDRVTAGTSYHYWVRFENTGAMSSLGPVSDSASATPSDSPEAVINAITTEILDSDLTRDLYSDVDGPQGVLAEIQKYATVVSIILNDAREKALSTLETTVTTQGGTITEHSASIMSLRASVPLTEEVTTDKVTVFASTVGAAQFVANVIPGEKRTVNVDVAANVPDQDLQVYRVDRDGDKVTFWFETGGNWVMQSGKTIGIHRETGVGGNKLFTEFNVWVADAADVDAAREFNVEMDVALEVSKSLTNSIAIGVLESSVTTQGNSITANANSITNLRSTVQGKADTSALNALETRVEATETGVTGNARDITALEAGVTLTVTTDKVTVFDTSDIHALQFETNVVAGMRRTVNVDVGGGAENQELLVYKIERTGRKIEFWFESGAAWASRRNGTIGILRTVLGGSEFFSEFNNWQADAADVDTGQEWSVETGVSLSLPRGTANAWAISELETTVESQGNSITANASDITTLKAQVDDGTTASAVQELTARVTRAEGVTGTTTLAALARWLVKTTVDDLTGGVGLYNDGTTVRFVVNADRFAILQPGENPGDDPSPVVPFSVVDGKVYIDLAYIRDATITVAKMENLFLSNLEAKHGTLASARIEKANIFDLAIDNEIKSNDFSSGVSGYRLTRTGVEFAAGVLGVLKSTNFRAGSAGWILNPNGTAEFDAASIRGTLSADHIDSDVQNADVLHGYHRVTSTPSEIDLKAGWYQNFDGWLVSGYSWPRCLVVSFWIPKPNIPSGIYTTSPRNATHDNSAGYANSQGGNSPGEVSWFGCQAADGAGNALWLRLWRRSNTHAWVVCGSIDDGDILSVVGIKHPN